ncbi:MAG: hypothetical protein ABIQ55_13090, partial [Gemmatimonadaceae bacterium]
MRRRAIKEGRLLAVGICLLSAAACRSRDTINTHRMDSTVAADSAGIDSARRDSMAREENDP